MASSSSEEDEEEMKIMAEIAGCAHKDVIQAKLVSKQPENGDKNNKRRSKRNDKDCEETQDSYLTPECKRHIAKKLSSYLDGCIQVKSGHTDFKHKEMMSQESGIHLLHSSRNKLLDMENDRLKEKQRKKSKRCSSSESSDDENEVARFQEAAVSGQSIIDKSCLSSDNGINKEDNSKKKKKKKKEHKKDKKINCISECKSNHVKDRWKLA